MERLAATYAGRAKIVKINVDDESALAGQFSVRSIPALMFFVEGQWWLVPMGAPPQRLSHKP